MNTTNRTRALAASGWLALIAGCAHGARPAAALDSVPVGYGTQLRRNVLGPVASVDLTRDAERPRGVRIEELLEGRVAGVEVRRLPNGELSLRLRGAASLSGDGEPLVVVDGVPAPHGVPSRLLLRDIDPGDVARVDVLKGSAAAIYGSRGANGVILITLRRGYR
jgi:TonB-dependent starch-binding outer membrane protein SusC